MNFFSHALIARRRSSDARWVLGAMLPDFFTMAGLRIESVGETSLRRGIEFHHLCDDVFHNAPLVVELMNATATALLSKGLDKGPSRAVGHVGLELLLDGVMVSSGIDMAFYRAAIMELDRIETVLRFHGEDDHQLPQRWRNLARYLPTAPIPEAYAEPNFVATRLIRILGRYPVLAIPVDREKLVYTWAEEAAPEIEQLAPRILGELEDRLDDLEYTSPATSPGPL